MIRYGCDIGTKNLALCARDSETGSVVRWICVTIGSPSTPPPLLVRALHRQLEDFVTERDCVICIERQPPFARSVSHMLLGALAMWAQANDLAWELVPPAQRGGTYRERKAASVRLAREELAAAGDEQSLTFLDAEAKKDDLCDAYHLCRPLPRTK